MTPTVGFPSTSVPGAASSPLLADIDLDLTGAILIGLNLSRCTVRNARFGEAEFAGTASFDKAEFVEHALRRS